MGHQANWYRIKEGRYRIGIIDRCSMLHWSKPATDYPTQLEKTRMRQRLRNSQLHSIWQLQSGWAIVEMATKATLGICPD